MPSPKVVWAMRNNQILDESMTGRDAEEEDWGILIIQLSFVSTTATPGREGFLDCACLHVDPATAYRQIN